MDKNIKSLYSYHNKCGMNKKAIDAYKAGMPIEDHYNPVSFNGKINKFCLMSVFNESGDFESEYYAKKRGVDTSKFVVENGYVVDKKPDPKTGYREVKSLKWLRVGKVAEDGEPRPEFKAIVDKVKAMGVRFVCNPDEVNKASLDEETNEVTISLTKDAVKTVHDKMTVLHEIFHAMGFLPGTRRYWMTDEAKPKEELAAALFSHQMLARMGENIYETQQECEEYCQKMLDLVKCNKTAYYQAMTAALLCIKRLLGPEKAEAATA